MRSTVIANSLLLIFLIFWPAKVYSEPLRFKSSVRKSPVILIPGDGGSQLQARLNEPKVPHVVCLKKSSWFDLWLNLEFFPPVLVDCFADYMKLTYDRKTRKTSNTEGVEIKVSDFGNTSTIEYLDASRYSLTAYYSSIVNALVKKLGYKRGLNVRGVPFDFRKAPNEMEYLLSDLKRLIEETYNMNNNTPVTLIGHSMGNPVGYYFLQKQTASWKKTYVERLITLAAPWGGAVKALRLLASGDNLNVYIVNPLSVRSFQRSIPSSAWLMPYDTFWKKNEVLIYAPKFNYTVADYEKFLKDINYTDAWEMRKDTEPLIKKMDHPGVEVHCLHGVGVATPASFRYAPSQWYNYQPDVNYGDGDGTVNLRSLHGCLKWQKMNGPPVYHRQYNKTDHLGILHDASAIDYILKLVVKSKMKRDRF